MDPDAKVGGTSHAKIGGTSHAATASTNEPSVTQILPETRHLIGRQTWLAQIHDLVQTVPAKKLIVVQGPVGMGKSSELTRLARLFGQCEDPRYRVLWLPFQTGEWSAGPEAALDVILGTLLTECHLAPFPSDAPRDRLITALLHHLEQSAGPTVILLDNAECLLESNGQLAPCWETFLTRFLRSEHQASLILATKQWHGWPGRERAFLAEAFVPPLTEDESVTFLQRLGLSAVPVEHLRAVGAQLAGIPLLLEWTATVVVDPLLLDQWEGVEENEALFQTQTTPVQLVGRLQRLLQDPALLGTHLASKLAPLLKRIVEQHLSDEARLVLARLSVATLPLGKAALQVLCPRPRLLKELRDASLLAAYSNRVQLLPIVALTIQQQLTHERRREVEEEVIQAYTRWLDDGHLEMQEAGNVVTELAVLLLMHQRLLEVAELVVRYGWISLQAGHGPRLAHLAQDLMKKMNWHQTVESECAGLVLVQTFFPFLGKPVDPKSYVNYQRLWNIIATQKVTLPVTVGICVTHLLVLDATKEARFEDAQALLDAYKASLKESTLLLGEQALLLRSWSDYALVQGNKQQAQYLREQTIDLYRQLALQTTSRKEISPFLEANRKKRLANYLNSLAYHLNNTGRYEEALQMVEQSIPLKEQGYAYVGALAASYGEKAEILIELGRFQEALVFAEKAIVEIQRCVRSGDALSMEEQSIYQVILGRLYLRLGKIDEAERLFREALPYIHLTRRIYRMFAQDGVNEIEQWRRQSATAHHQLDWRWIERYRELCTYDSRWWLTWAGPFTQEELEQWDQLSTLPLDEATKTQLGMLMKMSRERELEAAITAQREPRLHYPAIAIEDIRRHIDAQQALRDEISQQEPNVIVRRFYQDAIEEELDYLHLIEATYEGNTERFGECNRRLFPLPGKENMLYAFTHVKHIVKQGLENPETAEISLQLQEFIRTHLHLSLDLTPGEEARLERIQRLSSTITQQPTVSAKTVQRFFTTILYGGEYGDWLVSIDQNAINARVEQGARHIYLPEKRFLLTEIKHLLIHELAGHVARCIAGEHSSLGLLGIHTKNCQPIDEGLALYYERQAALLRGEKFDESGLRIGTLAVGLACGIMTPPQTFLSLLTFIEYYTLLVRLLARPEANKQELQKQVRQYALSICLRIYRGVPHLEQAGICYFQDASYLHGLRLIERAVAQDEEVLDRLAVGKVALEHLPDLHELGIISASQPFKKLVFDPDLDAYILSFAQSEGDAEIRE